MHTTLSRCRQLLAFRTGPQADSRTRPVPSPQERRSDRIPEHRPFTGMGSLGDGPHAFPGTLPATDKDASDFPFFEGAVYASSGYGAW